MFINSVTFPAFAKSILMRNVAYPTLETTGLRSDAVGLLISSPVIHQSCLNKQCELWHFVIDDRQAERETPSKDSNPRIPNRDTLVPHYHKITVWQHRHQYFTDIPTQDKDGYISKCMWYFLYKLSEKNCFQLFHRIFWVQSNIMYSSIKMQQNGTKNTKEN